MQDLTTSDERKSNFGEVHTSFEFIQMMLEMLPESVYTNPNYHWLDPAAGRGYFFEELLRHLPYSFSHCHLHMYEINELHAPTLQEKFAISNIHISNFLETQIFRKYNVILANPPYNTRGIKKVPTNTTKKKKKDGETIWPKFIFHALSSLEKDGIMCMVVPSIWLKPDKAGVYKTLFSPQYTILKLRSFTSLETKKLFRGQAQTPITVFVLQNRPNNSLFFQIYDIVENHYVQYMHLFGESVPTRSPSIASKLMHFSRKYGTLHIQKSNPTKNVLYSINEHTDYEFYTGVKTCVYSNDGPQLQHVYSTSPFPFQHKPKLILAHKMYGIPYYDASGSFGISHRDNYILEQNQYNSREMKIIQAYLSSAIVQYAFDETRYRMQFLEKYAFEYIPNILKVARDISLEEASNDVYLCQLFHLTPHQQEYVLSNYNRVQSPKSIFS